MPEHADADLVVPITEDQRELLDHLAEGINDADGDAEEDEAEGEPPESRPSEEDVTIAAAIDASLSQPPAAPKITSSPEILLVIATFCESMAAEFAQAIVEESEAVVDELSEVGVFVPAEAIELPGEDDQPRRLRELAKVIRDTVSALQN